MPWGSWALALALALGLALLTVLFGYPGLVLFGLGELGLGLAALWPGTPRSRASTLAIAAAAGVVFFFALYLLPGLLHRM